LIRAAASTQTFDGFEYIMIAPIRTISYSLLLMLAYIPTIAQRKPVPNSVQTSFGSETPIKRPAKIPQDVLKQLLGENGEQIARCEELNRRHLPLAKYFTASAVDINGDRLPDLVVQAGEFCLQGAHNTPFWIFTKLPAKFGGYELVFKTQTDWLDIRKTSTNGYRDIADVGHTAVTLFTTILKFDGQKYQPRTCTVEDVRTKRITRLACPPRE
jgi:ketosteroid isomerase-like protein